MNIAELASMARPARHNGRRGGAMLRISTGVISAVVLVLAATSALASAEDDKRVVGELDVAYQAAVKNNDAATMRRILHEDFILVLGDGSSYTRDDLLEDAIAGTYTYERQDEDAGTQTVRVWGDTAVVTAKLWMKGVSDGKAFDRKLWFSDTYVRTADGWKYVFGQASLPLPEG